MTLYAFPTPRPRPVRRRLLRPRCTAWIVALAMLILCATSAAGQNLIDNGDFDTDVDGWSALSGFIAHDDTEGSTSGPGALSIFGQGGQSSAAQCVRDILASTTYTFGADFRIDAAPGRLNFCRVRIDGYDASSCTGPSVPEMGSVQETLASVSATYTSLTSSFVTGPSTAAVSFRLDCDRDFGNHTVKWDDAFLVAEEAEATRYTLLAGFGDVLYHLPGDDGLLGNGDDVMLADPTAVIGSDPNYRGAYSYRAGKVASTAGEPGLPDGFNRIAFLEGTVDVVPGGILVGSDLLRTGRRQGMGLRPWDGPVDDDYLAGDVMTLQAPFIPTGHSYVDGVLIPKANQLGATGLLFVDIAGLRPPNSNHPSGLPIRVVMAGVTGVPGMPAPAAPAARATSPPGGADLAVTKTADVSGLQAPGTFVDYTLTVGNAGPEIADGVVLRDRIPFETAYVGNDCGAPAPDPSNRIFPWDVGQLAAGGNADCKVTVQVLGDANFDFHNAAIAFGDSWDPNLADNVSERRVEVLDAAPPGIEQVPDRLSGFPSDLDCDACNSGVQAIADSFKLDAPVEICGVSFSGGYTDDLPFVDQFLIAIYDDNRVTPGIAGVPGDPVATLTAIPRRFATGERIDDRFDEFRYFVPLLPGSGPVLGRGRYWLVIVNDSSASAGTGDWFWESAADDAFGRSVPGIAFNPGFDNPSPGWGVSNRQTEAAFLLVLCLTPPDNVAIFADGFESGDAGAWGLTAP